MAREGRLGSEFGIWKVKRLNADNADAADFR